MPDSPNPPTQQPEDPVARSLKQPNPWAKPASMGKEGSRVWVRPILNNKKVKIRKKRKNHDYRDVTFY